LLLLAVVAVVQQWWQWWRWCSSGENYSTNHHKYSFVRHCVEAVLLSCHGLVVAVLGIKPQFTT
jgi:hypothetical protein